jgi:hypothetical protein
MNNKIIKVAVTMLSTLTLVGCMNNELKVEQVSKVPSGVEKLVLLKDGNRLGKMIRKSLVRQGFTVPPLSTTKDITLKSKYKDVHFTQSEARYGISVDGILSSNNPCWTNSNAADFTSLEYELIDLKTNKTLLFISKGGRTDTCPGTGDLFTSTTTLLDDLAKELAIAIQ